MSISVVQAQSGAVARGTATLTFANPVTTGNTIIVLATLYGYAPAPTDNHGNTYHMVAGAAPTLPGLFYAYDVTGGAGLEITVSGIECCCNTSDGVLSAYEVSGLRSTDPLDQATALNSGNSNSAVTDATSGTSQADELLVAWVGLDAYATSELISVPAGYGSLLSPVNGTILASGVAASVVSAIGSYTATFPLSGPYNWSAWLATFRGPAKAQFLGFM